MKFEKSIKNIIKKRRSVRTFADKKIDDDKRMILVDTMNKLSGRDFRFLIMDIDFKDGTIKSLKINNQVIEKPKYNNNYISLQTSLLKKSNNKN